MKYIAIGGGGFKAYTYIGALKKVKLEKIKAVSGSSAGSIIGFFVCLTKKYEDIESIALDPEYRIFDQNDLDIHNFFPYYGLNTGDGFEKKMETLCEKYTGNRRPSFKEFKEYTDSDFYVSATNLSKGTCEYFSSKSTPDFDVIRAIRMSISIPLYFTPIEYNGYSYVDGSFFKPIPYDILIKNYDDITPENALMIGSKETNVSEYNSFFEYIFCLFRLIRKGLIINDGDIEKFSNIGIDTSQFSFIDHKASNNDIEYMLEYGSNVIIDER